jgi:hypothetical protein
MGRGDVGVGQDGNKKKRRRAYPSDVFHHDRTLLCETVRRKV